jgi:hypothetical protein
MAQRYSAKGRMQNANGRHLANSLGTMRRLVVGITCVFTCVIPALADEPLPPRAIARLGSHRFYHGPGVHAVLSSDGSCIASAAADAFRYAAEKDKEAYECVIVLWDSTTGERLRELQVPHAPVYGLVFSPDSKRLAVSYGRHERHIALFDVGSGKLERHVAERSGTFGLVQFSIDGKSLFLTKGYRESLVLWDLANDKELREWKRLKSPSKWLKDREYVDRMVSSPDAKFIASLVDVAPDYSKVPLDVIVPPHDSRPTIAQALRLDMGMRDILCGGGGRRTRHAPCRWSGHFGRFSPDGTRLALRR